MTLLRQMSASLSMEEGKRLAELQSAVDRLSTPNIWMWVKSNDHHILAKSSQLPATPDTEKLMLSLSGEPRPQTIYLGQRVVMVSSSPLKQQGVPIAQLYIAQEITQDYALLNRLIRSSQVVSVGAIALLCLFMIWFIRRSLRPLNHLRQATLENTNLPPLDPEELPTEVRELAQTYNQLRDRLSESSLKQQQFTHNISHELRTPLSLVYGYLQSTLKRGPNLTESQQEALSIAVLETENIIQLLQALLEAAQLESSLSGLNLEPVQVNAIALEVVNLVQQFDRRTVQLEVEEAVMAIADRKALQRVLVQLLSNAVCYSPEDRPIIVRLFQQSDQVIIEVIDYGCGIERSELARIFEPLYRVESSRSRKTGGIGLGLSIVRSLVEGMGGSISVESEPCKGSTFTVTLRRAML